MKWKPLLYLTSIVIFCFLLFSPVYGPYPDHSYSSDGNILMNGGISLKPNTIHTYIPQFDGRYRNITLDSGTLTLSKSWYAYNINCSTNDNVTINIYNWVYQDRTRFQTIAENESSLSFTVNGRNREPRSVSGVSSWSYDEESTTVSLTTANYSNVIIAWETSGSIQLEWYLDRIPMWLGITGMICLVLSPVTLVYFMKENDYHMAFIMMLSLFIVGIGLLVGWLW